MMEKAIAVKPVPRKSLAPPLPREHGAWVILYAPFVIGLAAAWPPPVIPALLLFVAISGVYLARHVLSLLLRKNPRNVRENITWLTIYLTLTAVAGLPLLFVYGRLELLQLAALAAGIYLLHLAIEKLPTRHRLWRAQWSELVGMLALTLTAPAAYIAAGGAIDSMAWCLWTGCALFFGSGVFHIRMMLFATKEKEPPNAATRWRLGWTNLLYHALMMVAVYFATAHLPLRSAILLWLGFLPVVIRAVDGTITLSHITPSFKKAGWYESIYSLWFMVCFIGALHG